MTESKHLIQSHPKVVFLLVAIVAGSLVVSSGMAGPAFASSKDKDNKDKNIPKDFDIRSFGFDHEENPYLRVQGRAGGTLPADEEQIFAYVFYTDTGIWAVNNHGFGHGDPEGDVGNVWHSEQIFLNDAGCLTAAENESESILAGKRVTLIGTGTEEIFMVQTVELMHVAEDPTGAGCPSGSIAILVRTFDTATTEEDEDD